MRSSSDFFDTSTTSASITPALPTMPRPGSMMVSGMRLPKCLRRASKMALPYWRTAGTLFRYLVGKPPPRLTICSAMPRSARSLKMAAEAASAPSHMRGLRCCEPTWNDRP